MEYRSLSEEEKEPGAFEPFLAEHPGNEARRIAAMHWYFGKLAENHEGLEELKHHTLRMVEHHPDNNDIFIYNVSACYLDPEYRRVLIDRLEKQLNEGHKSAAVYSNLAGLCRTGALPLVGDDEDERQRIFRYYGLPKDTQLITEVDQQLAQKAVAYFRSAVEAATEEDSYVALYSGQLANLLLALDRTEEAAEACEATLPHVSDSSRPDFLVAYGRCLSNAGRLEDAKRILQQVRAAEEKGYEQGPGHATTSAESQLGFIALKEGDRVAAKNYLLSSCDVKKCCHNTTMGFSLDLADALFEEREYDAVITFCRAVLERFTPNQPETKRLLELAGKAADATIP
jgi:tetratricopeptide (TPR) repeat protein